MVTAAVLGAGFLYLVTRLWGLAQNGQVTGRDAMKVFGYSITYLTVLFVAMAGDVLITQPPSLASRRDDRRRDPPTRRRPPAPAAGSGADPDPTPALASRARSSCWLGIVAGRRPRHRPVHQRRQRAEHGGRAAARAVRCPSFTRQNIGPVGAPQVSVPADGGGNGTPTVLLFFGNWCTACHQELPPLAAAVRAQDKAGGALVADPRRRRGQPRLDVERAGLHQGRGCDLPGGLRPRRQRHQRHLLLRR